MTTELHHPIQNLGQAGSQASSDAALSGAPSPDAAMPSPAPPAWPPAARPSFAAPAAAFLQPEDIAAIRHQLRKIQFVEVRLFAGSPEVGAEVVAFLESEGLSVSYREISHISPPPTRRIVFRFSGNRALITLAPGAAL